MVNLASSRAGRGAASHRRRGAAAEQNALGAAAAQGYQPVRANYTVKGGEVDLIAWHGGVLCFMEVKHRNSVTFGCALEGVTPKKAQRIIHAAQRWLHEHPVDAPVRFDLMCQDGPGTPWQLFPDAFRPESP